MPLFNRDMKRSNLGAWRLCCLAMMFAMVWVPPIESGDRRISVTTQGQRSATAISIVDQNGRQASNGAPSANSQIFEVSVGQGFQFVPNMLNIFVGDTVRWTWVSSGHSVSSGTPCIADGQFCSPDNTNCEAGTLSDIGTVYEHTFAQPGTYSYFCAAHCEYGMTGEIIVFPRPLWTPRPRPTPWPRPTLPQ